jgi:hypothetical protein
VTFIQTTSEATVLFWNPWARQCAAIMNPEHQGISHIPESAEIRPFAATDKAALGWLGMMIEQVTATFAEDTLTVKGRPEVCLTASQ